MHVKKAYFKKYHSLSQETFNLVSVCGIFLSIFQFAIEMDGIDEVAMFKELDEEQERLYHFKKVNTID